VGSDESRGHGMSLDLTDKVTIVTGASSGIGQATAVLVAQRGARVIAVGRDERRLAVVCGRIADAGGEAHPISCDLRDERDPAAVAETAAKLHGRIDAIVHAAGVYEELPFAQAPLESLERQWKIHVRGPFIL